MKPTQALHEAGQSLWLDNITRALLDEGILARYVGLPAIEECICAAVPVNVTLLFSAGQYQAAAEAFTASWQDLLARIGARHEQLSRTA